MRINVQFLLYFSILAIGFSLPKTTIAQTFVGVSSNPADNSGLAGPTVAVTPPGGMAAGDLVVIYAHYRGTGASLSMSANAGQTWINETTSSGSTQTFDVFWCRFNGTWAGNPSVTAGAGNTNALTVTMYVFRPTSATRFWGVHVAATNSSSSTTTNSITGYATTVPNTVTMAFWCNALATTWTGLSGAGWSKTGLAAQYRNTSGSDQSNTAAYNIQSAAAIISDVSQNQAAGTATRRSILTWYEIPNDECTGSILLYSNSTCTNTHATLIGATSNASTPLGCAAAGTYYDTWFAFDAASTTETVTLSNVTGISSPRVQLYSGSCGALSSVACGTTSLTASGLSVGSRYYVRVSNSGASSSGTFDICVTHTAPSSSNIDYGKSYVNITRNTGGGTINPGDVLEVRGTLVLRNSGTSLDSLAFLDTLHLGGGVRLVPGSISLRTNEGVVYQSFTDAVNDDAGYFYTSGTDTVIRINFGTGATATKRGKLLNTSKPSVFGSTCIIMATYRVTVYATYGTVLNLGGGKITGSTNAASGVVNNYPFSSRNAVVYSSPGLCPNAVAPSNAIGGDFNGTFGSGIAQNRAASSNVIGYTYATFTTDAPGDYYYGIANNTSAGGANFSAITTWDKADPSPHRVFNLWDITGDHTGASNSTKGNPPCDPSKPVSATNPCGYMLVVNSAYKTDTAFQYTVSNLCPNTYYEISSWIKNICYKCGCDSNGVSANTAGYLPSGPNDSSGVQPNITFDINGVDYYTTGNIPYGGLFPSTQAGSDTNNTWVKRGFTYLTGAGQTSFTLTIRNNAPGGGGNDWAMDDIALATCLPNMQYSPSLNPFTCSGNTYDIKDTIRSYFSNYINYKWQKSTNNGATWVDIPLATGTASPVWNGSAYQYITSYSIPPSNTNVSDSGNKYRVIVATTSGNLANTDCQITDGVSQITLNVGSCPNPLGTYILTFNGKSTNGQVNLNWSTNKEDEPVQFEIERSIDGINFIKVGSLKGLRSANESNYYNFADTLLPGKTFYRISLINTAGRRTYSRIIQLQNSTEFSVSNVTSYFQSGISLDVNVAQNSKVELALLNSSGSLVKLIPVKAYNGTNNFVIHYLDSLPRGIYFLQVRNNEKTITVKTIKK